MPGENILVIAVDGLRAASLGAYGNTSFATPALDRLAADSFLFDGCFAEAVDLPSIYWALWQSMHPLHGNSSAEPSTLPRLLAERGFVSSLVTDEPALAEFHGTAGFGEREQLPEVAATRAEEISQTSLARLFTAACEEIQLGGSQRFVWLHSRGFYGPWDAPLELQEPLLEREEGDPPPSDALQPPELKLDDSQDPDAVFRWSCAYAAQVMVLDTCIAALLETLAESARQPWLVVMLGVRGFPLGEHGRIGGIDGRLYAEQLQVPLMWHFPDGTGRLARSGQLVSHVDLAPTLLQWLDGNAMIASSPLAGESLLPVIRHSELLPRREIIAVDSGTRSIRTSDWSLRCEGDRFDAPTERDVGDGSCELFVRPDDRWEANDVASLCPDVVEDLSRRLADATASSTSAANSP